MEERRRSNIHSDDHKRLVAMLHESRKKAGLHQAELGRPQSFVAKYEHGQRRLDLVDLRAICKALGISLVGLIRRWEAGSP